jgi:hypothetical protein
MSDSLARLVLRARGELPVAVPLIPSRHASASSDAPREEADWLAADPVRGEPVPAPASNPVAMPASPFQGRGDRDPPARSVPGADRDPPPGEPPRRPAIRPTGDQGSIASPPHLPAAPAPQPAAPLPGTADARGVVPGTANGPRPTAAPALPPTAAPGRITERRLIDVGASTSAQVEAAPPRSPLPTAAALASRMAMQRASRSEAPRGGRKAASDAMDGLPAATQMPDVRISIGRVEVHAAAARPAPPRAVVTRPSPLSLADYLAQRK